MTSRMVLGVVAFVLCVAAGPALFRQPPALGQAEQPKARWEYRVVLSNTDHQLKQAEAMSKEFSALGAEGWEYAGPVSESTQNGPYLLRQGVFVLFKRPK
jgi:hypothetical protein